MTAVLGKAGPEDTLGAMISSTNSSPEVTAGNDWSIVQCARELPQDSFQDEAAALGYMRAFTGAGAEGSILRSLSKDRFVCTKPAFAYDFCLRGRMAHQSKQCTAPGLEYVKCGVKLARAVDTFCAKPFKAYAACMSAAGGEGAAAAKQCSKERVAFDVCTEDF